MTAKRQIESSINSGTMLDGTGGHVRMLAAVLATAERVLADLRNAGRLPVN